MSHPDDVTRAAEFIRQGKLVAFPTETVYGLGANAFDTDAVARIYAAKDRPTSSPLIVHVASEEMAESVVASWPVIAHRLAERYWPGPLTLVLPKSAAIPDLVTAGLSSVGVRVPSHPLALELIGLAGVPIAAPSANRFTQVSPTTAHHVLEGLGDRVDMILDGGSCEVGIESTIVSLLDADPVILRPGMITQQELESVALISFRTPPAAPRPSLAPGLRPKHYAPKTRIYLLDPDQTLPLGRGWILELPSNPEAFATLLYAELHRADQAGYDWIGIFKPPNLPAWAGILDRLQRASHR
ncbi:MAG: L-threonylcarbamoyladenylate synthase [Bryobacteraceae bacterium]